MRQGGRGRERLVEMSRELLSINLYFLNSTFICIYNISRFVVGEALCVHRQISTSSGEQHA